MHIERVPVSDLLPPIPGTDVTDWQRIAGEFPTFDAEQFRSAIVAHAELLTIALGPEWQELAEAQARLADQFLGEARRVQSRTLANLPSLVHGRSATAILFRSALRQVAEQRGSNLSALAMTYAEALQGDPEALETLWSQDLDDAPCIDLVRSLLLELARVSSELLLAIHEWPQDSNEQPDESRSRSYVLLRPHPDQPRRALVGSLERTGPPSTLTDVNPFMGQSVGIAA